MFTRGDHVVITANDARRGQTGTVVGEKTAANDLWGHGENKRRNRILQAKGAGDRKRQDTGEEKPW